MNTVLQIYVSGKCWGCQEARKIAEEMRIRFPGVRVDLVERESAEDWPEKVVATPAYVLNGKLISLGNPTRKRLYSLLAEAAGQAPTPAV